MSDISTAIEYLKKNGIDAFEASGVLTIPVSSPEEIYDIANTARRIFKEIDYQKSWLIDPYYYSKQNSCNFPVLE